MPLVFGLVHGLGFAGGLSEIGMPESGVGFALLGFGLGVEAGQLVFLVLMVTALSMVGRISNSARAYVPLVGSYVVGITGSFWLWQRIWLCLAAG
jgi:hypothetical protein